VTSHAESLAEPRPETAGTGRARDDFLDLLRALSVLRVVLLHLVTRPPVVYLPWIQWIYPGMPEIFFVSGSLMVPSLMRRRSSVVVRARLRRVFPPYVPYACIVVLVMWVTDRRTVAVNASFRLRQAMWFVFPWVRPQGSVTRVILWGHLWFVSAFLWLIVLSPLLWWCVKRAGALMLVVPLLGFSACVWFEKLHHVGVREEFWSLSQFGFCFLLGMVRAAGKFPNWRPFIWVSLAAVCCSIGVVIAVVVEPIANKPVKELYASRSAYLFLGTAWLFAAIAAHGPLTRFAREHRLRFLRACTKRTFTLYLWGPAADAVSVSIAKRLLPHQAAAIFVHVTVSMLVLAVIVVAVGWIEDVAARRPPRLLPTG
jgi:peptidoglycan/LPS O-acetylase OafA/YrhL